MSVTISPNASEAIRKAAAQVAAMLSKMSGREIGVTEGGTEGIVIGTLDQFPDAKVAEALAPFGGVRQVDEFTVATDTDAEGRRRWSAVEAYAIRTNAKGVRLLGRSDAAALRAAARFLELLGARRFTPSPVWEIVPQRQEIRFDAEEEQAPDYYGRSISWGFGPNPSPKPDPGTYNTLEAWEFMNRLGGAFALRTHHMYFTARMDDKRKEEIDANKDQYYALLKGTRNAPGMFCLSQPRMRELIAETALASFETRAGKRYLMASAEPPDGGAWCQCDACAAMGSRATRAFTVANEAAVMAEKWRPGAALIGINAYHLHTDPPAVPIEPNVFVLLATRMDSGRLAMDDLVEIWPKTVKDLGLYDYFSTFVWGQDRVRESRTAYVPAANPLGLARNLKGFYRQGYRAMLAESVPNFALYGPGYYVATQILWNTKADPKVLLDDYYKKAFGPAAEIVRGFYEFVNPESDRALHQNTFARVAALLDEADAAANGLPEVQARIGHLKLYLIGEYFQFNINNQLATKNTEAMKPWALRLFSHVHQTRFDWVNHYGGWVGVSKKSDKTYGEPDWVPKFKQAIPWKEKDSLSPQEQAAIWEELRAYWKPLPIEEKRFGSRLKLIRGSAPAQPTPSIVVGADGGGYFWSPDGKPLKFGISFPEPKQEVVASVRLYDEAGNEVFRHREELAKDSEAKTIEIEAPLPGPGTYRLTVQKGGNVRISPSLGQPFFRRDLNPTGFGKENYFYVPKGVTEIQCYLMKPAKVRTPGGSLLTVEPTESRITRIPVLEGDDGHVWSAERSEMVFLNIPNVIFFNPAEILVPEEIKVD